MNNRKFLLLADCDPAEIDTFKQGVESAAGLPLTTLDYRSNSLHGSKVKRLKRYIRYFTFPLRVFRKYTDAELILGWQQFYALNYAMFYRLFRSRRKLKIIAVNFTYKRKKGLVGSIYHRYMRYVTACPVVEGLHVPGRSYADDIVETLGIPRSKMIVTCFGTPDRYEQWKALEAPLKNYVLAIGRSNRDFDLLARIWSRPEFKACGCHLVVISDTWKPAVDLSGCTNIIHLTDVKGDASHAYFTHCEFSVVPIADGSICSGDTVLLNSMMMEKAVAVTAPSALSEMYIDDGVNGLYIYKDDDKTAQVLMSMISNQELRRKLGKEARKSFLELYTRRSMGLQLGTAINDICSR